MKSKLTFGIIFIFILFIVSGCSDTSYVDGQSSATISRYRELEIQEYQGQI